jgi:hypothetical protein
MANLRPAPVPGQSNVVALVKEGPSTPRLGWSPGHGGGNGGGPMAPELGERIAKLEKGNEHIEKSLQEIKNDTRELRNIHDRDFRILVGIVITAVLGLAGLMAKGFGWL